MKQGLKRAGFAILMPLWALPIVCIFTLAVAASEVFKGLGDALSGGPKGSDPFTWT
jgi:hypothetical protein